MAIDFFLPAFFLTKFPAFATEFAVLFGLSGILCGMASVIFGGLLANKLGEDSYSKICQASSLLACPLMLMALYSSNFFVSIGCVSLTYLLGNLWMSPNMTMMQRKAPSDQFGGIVSGY